LCPFCPPPGRPDGSRRLTGFFLSPHRSTAVSNSSNCPDPAAGEAPHSQPATLPTLAEATQSGPRLPTEESFLKQNHDFLAKAPHSSPKNKNHPACDKSDSPNWAVTGEAKRPVKSLKTNNPAKRPISRYNDINGLRPVSRNRSLRSAKDGFRFRRFFAPLKARSEMARNRRRPPGSVRRTFRLSRSDNRQRLSAAPTRKWRRKSLESLKMDSGNGDLAVGKDGAPARALRRGRRRRKASLGRRPRSRAPDRICGRNRGQK
jgi:hypothetical protein